MVFADRCLSFVEKIRSDTLQSDKRGRPDFLRLRRGLAYAKSTLPFSGMEVTENRDFLTHGKYAIRPDG